MLRAAHISVRYGDRTALRDLSFRLEEGQWLMLAGPNGAGKSTLIRALAQQLPYTGSFLAEGRDLRALRPAQRARWMGVLAQRNSAQYAYTVEEVVRLGRYARSRGFLAARGAEGDDAVEEALAMTGMAEHRRDSILTLSGGELQRAFLAQVFAQQPRLLVLDEPANHLDLNYQRHIFELIGQWLQAPGRAVLSVVHDLSLARRYGTHALLLDGGECVCAGEAGQALTPGNLQAVYGMDVAGWLRELSVPWQAPAGSTH